MARLFFNFHFRRGFLCLRIKWPSTAWWRPYYCVWRGNDEFQKRIQQTIHTGIFTVLVEGLYSLTWVTRVYCSKSYTTELHVNKSIAGSTFVYCGADTVTGNAVVQLRKGDVVFVRTGGEIRSNKYGRTSFSGFLDNWYNLTV